MRVAIKFTWYTLFVPSETMHTSAAWKRFELWVNMFSSLDSLGFTLIVFLSRRWSMSCISVVSLVFACSPLVWPEQQVRHHQTSGPHTPTASAPPLLLCPFRPPLQQGPQAVWGLRNGARITSLPASFCAVYSLPVLCLHSLRLLHQPPSSSCSAAATSCLLPILLLPTRPCPAPAISVQHTNQSVLHWERLWGGHGAEEGPVGESGRSPASAVEWVSGAPPPPPPQPEHKPFFLFLAAFSRSVLHSLQAAQ